MALTSGVHRERRSAAAKSEMSDIEAASREQQEKQRVKLSRQKILLASPAAWERAAMSCSLAGPSEEATQAPRSPLHNVTPLHWGWPRV